MLAGSLAALASCMPSPRAACIQSAEVEVDFINSAIRNFGQQISGRTAVIDRGYAIHSRQEKTLYIDKCEAEDGEEAFEILEDGEHEFDMMISDVVMPGMDGPTLLKKGRKMLGDARIVFISGYAAEEFSELLSEEPDVTFLPKPFTLAQLAEKVKAEIGESDV